MNSLRRYRDFGVAGAKVLATTVFFLVSAAGLALLVDGPGQGLGLAPGVGLPLTVALALGASLAVFRYASRHARGSSAPAASGRKHI
jgi:hypothetical protein